MTDRIKREIERLLDEPGELRASGQGSEGLRSRLAATLSEGLESAPAPSTGSDVPDIASIAAFIDGQLSGAERDKFVADLARQPSLRADVQSTEALVDAASDSTLEVPPHLLARANARFAPAPAAREALPRWDLSSWLSVFLPKQRVAWVAVAALALIVAVPAGLMIRGQSGGEQPELSGISEPDNDASQAQKDKDKACEEAKDRAKGQKSNAAPERSPSVNTPDDPCDPSKRKGATTK